MSRPRIVLGLVAVGMSVALAACGSAPAVPAVPAVPASLPAPAYAVTSAPVRVAHTVLGLSTRWPGATGR
jgi:hypothetical protein